MTGDSAPGETSARRRLGLMGRGAAVGAVVGWLVIVIATEVMLATDLVSRLRSETVDELGGVSSVLAAFLVAAAWGAVAGLIAGVPLGAVLGVMVGAAVPREGRSPR